MLKEAYPKSAYPQSHPITAKSEDLVKCSCSFSLFTCLRLSWLCQKCQVCMIALAPKRMKKINERTVKIKIRNCRLIKEINLMASSMCTGRYYSQCWKVSLCFTLQSFVYVCVACVVSAKSSVTFYDRWSTQVDNQNQIPTRNNFEILTISIRSLRKTCREVQFDFAHIFINVIGMFRNTLRSFIQQW